MKSCEIFYVVPLKKVESINMNRKVTKTLIKCKFSKVFKVLEQTTRIKAVILKIPQKFHICILKSIWSSSAAQEHVSSLFSCSNLIFYASTSELSKRSSLFMPCNQALILSRKKSLYSIGCNVLMHHEKFSLLHSLSVHTNFSCSHSLVLYFISKLSSCTMMLQNSKHFNSLAYNGTIK